MVSLVREMLDESAYERYMERKAGIWTMRDGTEIEIKDMTERHIRNCMRMVGKDTEWYEVFQNELNKRNEQKRK